MESADKMLERAKRLKPEELSELVARLDEYLSAPADENAKSACSYVRSLALSGTATPIRPMSHPQGTPLG